ncbi:MAG TPA: hypothetical protein VNQ77_20225 [Frankiaceae bacterium]|nr:hypothetical protein [Frankiaceae bacterium]
MTDPSPSASPDSTLLLVHAEWVEPAASRMVLTCTVRAGDGDRVVVRSVGGDGVAVIAYATTMEISDDVPVYLCSHATWYDASGYHDEAPPCLTIVTGTGG